MSATPPGVIRPRIHDPQLTPVPRNLVLAAFDFKEATPQRARDILRDLAEIVRRELSSTLAGINPLAEKDEPSFESGELGFDDRYDRGGLTITLGISSTGFGRLGAADQDRPADLRPIPWDKLGDTPPDVPAGDLLLLINSDDLFVCEHVVRSIERRLGDSLSTVWTQIGVQRFGTRQKVDRDRRRAMIGFLDGTSNLRPSASADDAALVRIDPDTVKDYPPLPESEPNNGPIYPDDLEQVPQSEPEWTRNGTYLTVRVSEFETAAWDQLSQSDQESAVGRFKVSGAALDREDSTAQLAEPPAFVANQNDETMPLTAHVRKAFSRYPASRLYRHGFSVIRPKSGGLGRGLAFVAFARTISAQFEFLVRGQMRNKDYPTLGAGTDDLFSRISDKVLSGGYYFVPAVADVTTPWAWVLPDLAK